MMAPKKNRFLDSFPDHVYRYIDQTGEGRPPVSSNTRRDDLNIVGYEAYFTVNGFDGSTDAKKDRCTSINAFFVDIDGRKDPNELERIKEKLEPTFILETMNGYHIYWLLDETVFRSELSPDEWSHAVSRWERIEQSIVTTLDADPVVKDITRIMRIPDTYYWKKSGDAYRGGVGNAPFIIKGIHKKLSANYSMDQVEEAFPIKEVQQLSASALSSQNMEKYAESERKAFFDAVNKEYPITDRPSFQRLIKGDDDSTLPRENCANNALLVTASLMRMAGWSKQQAIKHIETTGWHGIEKESGGKHEILNTIESAYRSGYTYSYKNEFIAFNTTPEEQLRIQGAYTKVAKDRREIDKVRFSNYEYEIAARLPNLRKNEVGLVFNYVNGVYRLMSDQDMSNLILNMLYEDMLWGFRTKKHVADKVACLLSVIPDLELTDDDDMFNVKNGLLKLSTGELLPHTPEYVSLVQSPVAFDPSATAPTWSVCMDAWMAGSEKSQKTEILQQFAGVLLSSSMAYAKALFLVGDGGNGKSTFADTIGMVIGNEGTSRIDLEDLYSPFGLKGLIGKRLNIIEEVSGNYYQSHKLKKLISGEELTINMKYKDQFKFKPTAKFIFAVNTMPRVDDSSNAMERRLAVVQFNNNFRNNPNTALRFGNGVLARELSGILNWMLAGYQNLMATKQFTVTQEQKMSLLEYREENSSVEGFIGECVIFSEGSEWSARELYTEYKEYCVKDGRKFKSAIAFTKEIRAHGRKYDFFEFLERKSGHGASVFRGIELVQDWSKTSLNSFMRQEPKKSPYTVTNDDDEL